MLVLAFEGWFQCRLATNPDPTDESRGVSGYTYALPGEPDLDRVIRLQNPVTPRSHGPEVGVQVRTVAVNGRVVPGHPLEGGRLDLLGDPKFESRNLLLTDDRAGIGLIHPFHLQVVGEEVQLRREDLLHGGPSDLALYKVPVSRLNRRAPEHLDGMFWDPLRVAESTGIVDPVAYRRERSVLLEADLQKEAGENHRAALGKRLEELSVEDRENIRVVSLSRVQTWAFALNGPAEVKGAALKGVDTEQDWPIEFWMGAWDADALCGYMRGRLTIPFRGERAGGAPTRETPLLPGG